MSTRTSECPCDQPVVNHVFLPTPPLTLLHPKNPVIVRHRRDKVRPLIAVDIDRVYEGGVAELKIGMPCPSAAAQINGRLEPAFRRNDIGAAIAINVPGADAMPITVRADNVLGPRPSPELIPGQRSLRIAELGQQLSLLSVVVNVDQKCEFHGRDLFNDMTAPRAVAASGILPPLQAAAEPGAAYDIHVAVLIDIDRQIAEVIDIVLDELNLAKLMTRPFRAFVPILARNDVERSVGVDVGECARLARAVVYQRLLKANLRRP
jgi:hypothetical protein